MRTKYPLNNWKSAIILVLLALPFFAQAGQHHRYKLIDLGTFGGPLSTFESTARILNNQGSAVGAADTDSPDPFAPNCFTPNCLIQHAFQWSDGVLTDLGALAEGV